MSKTMHVNDSRLRVSRRGFLQASGVGAATLAGGGLGVIPYTASRAAAQQSWDLETDIVVVGSGGAAFAAAITARANGAEVAMFEKGAYAGGTTLVSGGGAWMPNNHLMQADGFADPINDAIAYMARYSFPHLYNPEDAQFGLTEDDYALFTRYVETAGVASGFLEEQGAIAWTYGRNFGPKFDQVQIDYMETYEENKAPTHRTIHPTDENGGPGSGGMMIAGYQAWAADNGITLELNHRVDGVITNAEGHIIGVEVSIVDPAAASSATPEASPVAATTIAIRARKGVIFGSGGFARNEDMMHHLMPAPYYGGCSAPTNEGDLLLMSTTLGAKIGNLHNVWRNQGIFEQAVADTGSYNCLFFLSGDSFLQVNKNGKRFVNEKRNYQDRPMAHQDWNATYGDWDSRLAFHIYDSRVHTNWGGSFPYPAEPETTPYIIMGETLEDLAANIAERIESLRAVSGNLELHGDFAANLAAEVARFNEFATAGVDEDFDRGANPYDVTIPYGPTGENQDLNPYPSADQANAAMYPLAAEGPYYAFIVSASAVDTSGGPVINPDGQIVRWDGSPIVGLYGAGNCIANPGANAYWGGGATIGNGHVWGYNAAMHAVNAAETVVS